MNMVLLRHTGAVNKIKGENELARVVDMYLQRKFPVFYLLDKWFINRYAGVFVLLLIPLLLVLARQVCFVVLVVVFDFLICRNIFSFMSILPTYNRCISDYAYTSNYLEVQARLLYLEMKALLSLKEKNKEGVEEAYGTVSLDFDKELAIVEADFEDISSGYLGYLYSMFNAMDGSEDECLKFSISDYPNKYSSFNRFVDSYKQDIV